jgi:hypothetical protein
MENKDTDAVANAPVKGVRRYVKVLFVYAILLFLIKSIFGVLFLLVGTYLLKYKNWARISFIVLGAGIIFLNLFELTQLSPILEKASEAAEKLKLNQTVFLSAVVGFKLVSIGYFTYGIMLFNKPAVKTLYTTQVVEPVGTDSAK